MKACLRTSNGHSFTNNHPRPSSTPSTGEVLVKIRAAAINPVDYKAPKMVLGPIMGLDFAGVVEAVPATERVFKVGDEVYGTTKGSLAEYAMCKAASIALKPKNLSFEETAALPTSYVTGLQALRDKGAMREGDRVLVIGASGGSGLAGLHLAKALGASEIVGICSGKNRDMVMKQGATKVVDYKVEKVEDVFPAEYFDVVYDTATASGGGENYFSVSERLLKKDKKNVHLNGGAWTWMSYFCGFQKANRRLVLTDMNTTDLEMLARLFNTKQLSAPIIAKIFHFNAQEVKEGYEQLQSRRTVGKLVFTVSTK